MLVVVGSWVNVSVGLVVIELCFKGFIYMEVDFERRVIKLWEVYF